MPSSSCIYADRSGVVWIGTTGYGILKYNPRTNQFHFIPAISTGWMHEMNDGRIIVSLGSKVAYLFDSFSGKFEGMLPDSAITTSFYYDHMGVFRTAIQSRSGLYWITKDRLLSYDIASKKITQYDVPGGFPLYEDGKKELWFGLDDSFCRFDEATKKFSRYPYPIPAEMPHTGFLKRSTRMIREYSGWVPFVDCCASIRATNRGSIS